MVLTPWLTTVFTIVYHGALLPQYTMVILVPIHHGINIMINYGKTMVKTVVNHGVNYVVYYGIDTMVFWNKYYHGIVW